MVILPGHLWITWNGHVDIRKYQIKTLKFCTLSFKILYKNLGKSLDYIMWTLMILQDQGVQRLQPDSLKKLLQIMDSLIISNKN